MASVALNLYSARLEVTVDPHLRFAPVALRLNADSWLALNADEASALGQQLLDAAASLRLPEGVILTGNAGVEPGTWTRTPATADGHAAPLPSYPPETWPTCQPVAPGVDSLGHGFDRRAQPVLGKAA